MADEAEPPQGPTGFDRARSHLEVGLEARREMGKCWDKLRATRPFTFDTVQTGPNSGRLEVSVRWPRNIQHEAERAAQRFVDAVTAAFDDAVRAAISVAAAGSIEDFADARMPLSPTDEAFMNEAMKPALRHLRPDQLDLLQLFQPFGDAPLDIGVSEDVRQAMNQLLALVSKPEHQPRVAVWAHRAQPLFRGPAGEPIDADCAAADPGVINPRRSVADFTCAGHPFAEVTSNPNMELSPVFDAPPFIAGEEGMLDRQTLRILGAAVAFVDAMERSSSPDALLPGLEWFAQQVGRQDRRTWRRVDLERSRIGKRLRRGLKRSELGIATYTSGEGATTMFVRSGKDVFARIVPAPRPAPEGMTTGHGVEHASLLAASEWGLPDFVMRPQLVRKGEGSREVGDGTVVTGDRALAIQVKARAQVSGSDDREHRWVLKQIKAGSSQASGTIRLLRTQPVTMTNHRDRQILVDGSKLEWLRVVIVDHPFPIRLAVEREPDDDAPLVVLLRRDWEFLLDQLRSLTGVVDYLFRVATDERYEVGDEPARYFEVAHSDVEASGGSSTNDGQSDQRVIQAPSLPLAPASQLETTGHFVYRSILEEMAHATWERDESDRLVLLSLLDRYPAGGRAELGRLMLDRLADVMTHTEDVKWLFRRVILDEGRLQLAFATTSKLDEGIEEAFRQWALLRHHDFFGTSPNPERDSRRTVAVLMTPCHNGLRYWDTSTCAIMGDPELDDDEIENFRKLWGNPSAA